MADSLAGRGRTSGAGVARALTHSYKTVRHRSCVASSHMEVDEQR
jgi:hypothetical protein